MSDTGNPYADTREMYTVHTMFRREFALLSGLVRSVTAGDAERAQIVADHIRLVSLVLHEHHSGEDAVLWPKILTRASREIDPVVLLVEGHHEAIDALTSEAEVLMSAWTDTAATADGEDLADALDRLAVALYEHMGLEEKLILPLVERHIFASEWEKMVEEGTAQIPPELGPVLVGMLMYEGGLDAVPPEMRTVLADVAPQAYAAHAERVHGTPTPPRSNDVVAGRPVVGLAATAERV